MHKSQSRFAETGPDIRLTSHASQRMNAKGISHAAVQAALRHGRVVHVRSACARQRRHGVLGRERARRHRRRAGGSSTGAGADAAGAIRIQPEWALP